MQHGNIPGGRAFRPQAGVRIAASAIAFPEPIVLPNGTRPEWIANEDIFGMGLAAKYADVMAGPDYAEQVGLKHRRWTHLIGTPAHPEEETCIDLGVKAARIIFKQLELGPQDIDLVLFATATGTSRSNAGALAAQVGIQAPCFDLAPEGVGGVYALISAAMHIQTGFDRVLLIAAETPSKFTNPQLQETVISVGDGAAAFLLTPAPKSEGLLAAFLGTDVNSVKLNDTAEENEGLADALNKAVADRYLDAMQGVLLQAGLTPEAIDWYIPHELNRAMTLAIAHQLGIAPEKQVHILHQYGNLAGAGVLIALHEALQDRRIQAGHTVALNTVEAGLSWGALLWQF